MSTSAQSWKQQLRTVGVFTKLSTKRFFRDRLAQFFSILFPLIFLFVFGSLNSGNKNVTFDVAVLNQSKTSFAAKFDHELTTNSTFKVDSTLTTLSAAQSKMTKNQLDGIIILPSNFGTIKPGQHYPSGQARVLYDESNAGTGQTLTSVLQSVFNQINAKFVTVQQPFAASGQALSKASLSSFDYTF
jgi:ABC-2 type transport system permease protein